MKRTLTHVSKDVDSAPFAVDVQKLLRFQKTTLVRGCDVLLETMSCDLCATRFPCLSMLITLRFVGIVDESSFVMISLAYVSPFFRGCIVVQCLLGSFVVGNRAQRCERHKLAGFLVGGRMRSYVQISCPVAILDRNVSRREF